MRMGDWKLIRQYLKDPKNSPTIELYNLAKDPNEKQNVAKDNPSMLEKMAKLFKDQHQNAEIERFRIPMVENGVLGLK